MTSRAISRTDADESTGQTIAADDCPDCDGRLRTDAGETRCAQCGLVIECGRIDRRGKRVFDEDDETTERTGSPLTATRHDRGLSTTIGHSVDAKGNTLSSSKQRQLARLRREHKRARWRSKAERNLGYGLTCIARLMSELDLPRSLREQASSLFRTAQDAGLLRGRSIEGIAAGSVYAVCRLNDITRTLAEITAVARVNRTRIRNGYSALNLELELPTPPQRPRAYLPSLAAELDLPAAVERRAHTLASEAHDRGVTTGKHPAGFAAACLTVAATEQDVDCTQRALAEAASVSRATVRAHRETLIGSLEEAACLVD